MKKICELKNFQAHYNIYPLSEELLGDMITPVSLFIKVKNRCEDAQLFESIIDEKGFSRYSYILSNPKEKFEVYGDMIKRYDLNCGTVSTTKTSDPFKKIEEEIGKYKSPEIEGLPKFTGGFSGYFSYDSISYIENKLKDLISKKKFIDIPDIYLIRSDEVIIFDHLKNKIILTINIPLNGDSLEDDYREGINKLTSLKNSIIKNDFASIKKRTLPKKVSELKDMVLNWDSPKEEYLNIVKKAKEEIVLGNIFQVVLSRRLTISNPPCPFNTYRRLRSNNPSPYMYYIKSRDFNIVGTSPEKLISIEDGECSTKPIAGTIKRGSSLDEDKKNESILLSDEKEKSEHIMLVDLGRNDLGKISKFGTVETKYFMNIERFSKVLHIVSDVRGKVRENISPIDAIKALFPAGTLSGAPKIRAMELINELEKTKRGPYGGAIGYISYSGSVTTAITIRTAVFKDDKGYVQAGAGIVYDSDPEKEYYECEAKASGVLESIKEAYSL